MLTLEKARQWYPETDAVHGFDHIERVYGLCQQIGEQENADMEILLTAALLHDSQGSHPGKGQRNDHHLRSANFAAEVLAEEGWENGRVQAVQHCIRAHRYRRGEEAPESLEAKILFDADKLDVIGAVGVVRALAYAFQVKQPAFTEPSPSYLQHGTKADGEGHSAYHEYLFKLKKISSTLFTDTARQIASRRQQFLNDYFEELAAEMRGER
jgi:uncharacterized protein